MTRDYKEAEQLDVHQPAKLLVFSEITDAEGHKEVYIREDNCDQCDQKVLPVHERLTLAEPVKYGFLFHVGVVRQ
jgi:hypothetical protein